MYRNLQEKACLLALRDFHSVEWKLSFRILQYTTDVGAERWVWSKQGLLGCAAELLSWGQLLLFTLCISWAGESLFSQVSMSPRAVKKALVVLTCWFLLIWLLWGCYVIWRGLNKGGTILVPFHHACVALVTTEEPFAELLLEQQLIPFTGPSSRPQSPTALAFGTADAQLWSCSPSVKGCPRIWPSA